MRACRLFVAVLFFSIVLSCQGFSQVTGTYPFGPFDTSGFDTINRGNLNIHFSIPIFAKPGRGGSNFVYYLNYDGLIWNPTSVSGASVWTPVEEFGWTDTTNAEYGYVTFDLEVLLCGYEYQGDVKIPEFETTYSNYIYHDNHGNGHPIPYSDSGTCGGSISPPSGTATYTLTDNSGLTIYRNAGSFVVFTQGGAESAVPDYMLQSNGTPYFTQSTAGASTFTDTNGNEISASSSGVFTDTMGKTVLTVSGTAPSPVVYTYTDSNGNSQTVTVNYTEYTVQTNFGVSGISEYSASNIPLVSSIVYSANNTSYTFTYEQTPGNSSAVTGRIASITLPTGGTINYSYTGGNNGIESDGTVAGLMRTTSDGTTTYVRSGISSTASTTTFTDATGNQTVSTFQVNSSGYFYEDDRKSYTGTASGTPLKEIQSYYCYDEAECISNTPSLSYFTNASWTTLLNGNVVDEVNQSYAGPELLQGTSETASGVNINYNYNQYSGPYGIPFYRLSSMTGGSGSSTSQETTYNYDETAPTTTSGLPQHASVSTTRGNLTSVHQWYNSSGSSLNTTMTYDDAGQVLSQTDTNGDVTNYTYDPSTDTLLTQITLPSVNGNRYSASFSFDSNTGLLLSSTDLNSQTTSYSYDGMLRPKQISYPDGGKTTYTYTTNQTSQYRYQTASTYEDTEMLYDGYGRVSRLEVANGQSSSPWYQTDTCYNSDGELSFQSYAYQGGGFSQGKVCSGSGDSYTYDALGRTLKITHGDSTSINYAYNATAVEVTDESGVSKIINMLDANRIAAVCEISSNSAMPDSGSPASCNTPISGTGFLTVYTYSLLNHEVTVTQGSQTRVFQTDWAGRPILQQEPESGQTTWVYSYNSSGLQVVRTRPTANQTNPGTTTTTTTQYDALGRVTNVSYSDGTPTKQFYYDQATAWGGGSVSLGSSKGRLTEHTVNGAGNWTGAAYGYDAMGRIIWNDQCVPSGCGNTAQDKVITYTYDWLGNILTARDGTGTTISYTYSPADQVQSITSSLNNSTNPPSLVSSIQNGPDGPISYSYGNGLSQYDSYDTLGRLNGGWVCVGAPSFGCSTQKYGFYLNSRRGDQVLAASDDIMGSGVTYAYDEFDRLTSMSSGSGQALYSYTYDRYGNRWAQDALQGGLSPSVSFDTANNHINSTGFAYDAAGNMVSDGTHTYTYDAEGNLTAVDSGATAKYTYNALNQRVRIDQGSDGQEFVFNLNGQRISTWDVNTGNPLRGQEYYGTMPVEFHSGGQAHFQHLDWLGTERVVTSYNGSVEGTFSSLPFGDGYTVSGSDGDPYHFAGLDKDYYGSADSGTDHAQFRQYNDTLGNWLSPDPYSGSYDLTNPQSLNRYSYVLNNPMAYIDPDGTTGCQDGDPSCDPDCEVAECSVSYPNGPPGAWPGAPIPGTAYTDGQGGYYALQGYDPVTGDGIFGYNYSPGFTFFVEGDLGVIVVPPAYWYASSAPAYGEAPMQIGGGGGSSVAGAPNGVPSVPKPPDAVLKYASCAAQVTKQVSQAREVITVADGVTFGNAAAGCILTGPGILACETITGGLDLVVIGAEEGGLTAMQYDGETQCIQQSQY